MVSLLWPKASPEKRHALKSLNYYVIGYTSLAAILTFVALAGLLAVTAVHVREAVEAFRIIGYGAITLFLVHAAWILFRGMLDILSSAETAASSGVRALLVSVIIVALSGLNFLFSQEQDPLTADLMDIERRENGHTVVTFVVANTTSKQLAISLVDGFSVIATGNDGTHEEKTGYPSEDCELTHKPPFFKVIEPGKSEIFSTHVCHPEFGSFLVDEQKYVDLFRAPGRDLLLSGADAVTLEVKLRVFDGSGSESATLGL